MVINTLSVNEVVEELVARLWLGLRNHVSSFGDSYDSKVVVVHLVMSGVLISTIPAIPVSNFFTIQLLHVLFGVSIRDNIIPISTEKPNFHLVLHDVFILID